MGQTASNEGGREKTGTKRSRDRHYYTDGGVGATATTAIPKKMRTNGEKSSTQHGKKKKKKTD